MTGITAITATRLDREREGFLIELANSINDQPALTEWVICVNRGDDRASKALRQTLQGELRKDLRLTVLSTHGLHAGAAGARNLAMVNASEPYVTSIDDDDLFPSRDVFSSRLQTMEENPKMSFITGYLANLEPTTHGVADPNIPFLDTGDLPEAWHVTDTWKNLPGSGVFAPGELMKYWNEPESEFPANTAGALIRKSDLLSSGGCLGIPSAEDFGMIARLSNRTECMMVPEVVYLYRKHPQQGTKSKNMILAEAMARIAVWSMSQ